MSSTEHHTLTGIRFGGDNYTQTSKVRTTVLSVNNSAANSSDTSNVTGVLCDGTGSGLTPSSFSFNSIKGSTINVFSNGAGNKRGILVSNSNQVSTRDTNVYVAKPTATSSAGSYVGVETDDPGSTGSIQLRSTTVGCVFPTSGESYTASDILQTTPATITTPTYLASPGIQIGPGTDLVTKSAGGKGFSTYVYPTTVFYGLKGDISTGQGATLPAWLWPGTQKIDSNDFPDPTLNPRAFYRIQQPALLSGIAATLGGGPGPAHTVTITVAYTSIIPPNTYTLTNFTIEFSNDGILSKSFYNSSVRLNTGDLLHLQITYTGGNSNNASDLSVQIDLF